MDSILTKFKVLNYSFITFILLLLIASCSSSTNSALRSKISGQGKLQIDSTNPYLAPAKFLSNEAELSETLKGFLTLKGNPESISYSESFFSSPNLILYFDKNDEKYLLEYINKDWLINGPYKISEKEAVINENASQSVYDENTSPLIDIDKNETIDLKDKTPPVKTAEKDKPEEAKTIAEPKFEDIFHFVQFDGESIEFLAQWYTKDISNSSRIRSINSLPPGLLKNGTSVRIPSYLLKQKESPKEEDVKKFIGSFSN